MTRYHTACKYESQSKREVDYRFTRVKKKRIEAVKLMGFGSRDINDHN